MLSTGTVTIASTPCAMKLSNWFACCCASELAFDTTTSQPFSSAFETNPFMMARCPPSRAGAPNPINISAWAIVPNTIPTIANIKFLILRLYCKKLLNVRIKDCVYIFPPILSVLSSLSHLSAPFGKLILHAHNQLPKILTL